MAGWCTETSVHFNQSIKKKKKIFLGIFDYSAALAPESETKLACGIYSVSKFACINNYLHKPKVWESGRQGWETTNRRPRFPSCRYSRVNIAMSVRNDIIIASYDLLIDSWFSLSSLQISTFCNCSSRFGSPPGLNPHSQIHPF